MHVGRLAALRGSSDVRSGNDNLSINKVLVELGVLAFLVGGGDELVALLLDPFPDAKLVLGSSEHARLLLSVDTTLVLLLDMPTRIGNTMETYIVEDEKNFALL